ncbi:hypothetical protein DDB_G0292580 [Dictyostelium discoideum AX4]|uniref:Uncharacterized protein n=1 Tax=Dictyostelium discoideum TaxID=44689 RepID=Q54D15_DICDI|nr:hypothetical protein DDB_G0292580 [Dictyostelium discoideum AX4]EAL61093.1 hypothetical protein DDB_G0292580 [Dictyostelium discoideum AX4]|eukprot:XP_629505.1 hypothetical protein DDB_G0292580 [Dictyostelium discoideum AX4]
MCSCIMYFENCNSNDDEFYSMLLNNNRYYSYKSNEPRRNQLFKNSFKFGNFKLFKLIELAYKQLDKPMLKIEFINQDIYRASTNSNKKEFEKYKSLLLSSSSSSSSSQEISNIEPSFKLDPPICYSHRLYSITIAMKAMIGLINSPSLSNGCSDSDGDDVIFKNEHFFGLNNLKSISDFIYLINHKFTNQKGPFYFNLDLIF